MGNNDSRINDLWEEANSYHDSKEYKKEIDCCDQLLKIDPKNIRALNEKGVAYNYLKEH